MPKMFSPFCPRALEVLAFLCSCLRESSRFRRTQVLQIYRPFWTLQFQFTVLKADRDFRSSLSETFVQLWPLSARVHLDFGLFVDVSSLPSF